MVAESAVGTARYGRYFKKKPIQKILNVILSILVTIELLVLNIHDVGTPQKELRFTPPCHSVIIQTINLATFV